MFKCRKAGAVMDVSSFLVLPSTLTVDRVEQNAEALTIFLHATTSCVCCPTCGTAGSRVHSRYFRTVADLPCVGQRLRLKLLVRKWICPLDSCPPTHLCRVVSRAGAPLCTHDRSVDPSPSSSGSHCQWSRWSIRVVIPCYAYHRKNAHSACACAASSQRPLSSYRWNR